MGVTPKTWRPSLTDMNFCKEFELLDTELPRIWQCERELNQMFYRLEDAEDQMRAGDSKQFLSKVKVQLRTAIDALQEAGSLEQLAKQRP